MARPGSEPEPGLSKKAEGEYVQNWEWGETGQTDLLHFAGEVYDVHPTLRNSQGSGLLHSQTAAAQQPDSVERPA